jgi:hypothetical protein
MKKSICVVAALLTLTTPGWSATKTLKRTIDESQLQGYVATPPTGWAPTAFIYGAATPIGSENPAVYAITNRLFLRNAFNPGAPPPTAPPPPAGLTLISLSRYALTKENLPDAVQITAADCVFSAYGVSKVCPYLYTAARPAAALPGGLVVLVMKPVVYRNGAYLKYWEYVFDPSAVGADRWRLVQDGLSDTQMVNLFVDEAADNASGARGGASEVNIPGQTFKVADVNWYLFKRQSPTVVQVFQIAPK